jgi:hypothetical protein
MHTSPPWLFGIKWCMPFSNCPKHATFSAHLIPLNLISLLISGKESKLLIPSLCNHRLPSDTSSTTLDTKTGCNSWKICVILIKWLLQGRQLFSWNVSSPTFQHHACYKRFKSSRNLSRFGNRTIAALQPSNFRTKRTAARVMAANVGEYYEGSRIFTWVSDLSGLPLDQVSSTHRKCIMAYFKFFFSL